MPYTVSVEYIGTGTIGNEHKGVAFLSKWTTIITQTYKRLLGAHDILKVEDSQQLAEQMLFTEYTVKVKTRLQYIILTFHTHTLARAHFYTFRTNKCINSVQNR